MTDLLDGVRKVGAFRGDTYKSSVGVKRVELAPEPKYSHFDDNDAIDVETVLPDILAETFVKNIVVQANGTGTIDIHNGDEVTIGDQISYAAGRTVYSVEKGMGLGNPCQMNLVVTTGKVEVTAEYEVKQRQSRRYAKDYVDA